MKSHKKRAKKKQDTRVIEQETKNKKREKIFALSFFLLLFIGLITWVRVDKYNLKKAIEKNTAYAIATLIKYKKPAANTRTKNAKISFVDTKGRDVITSNVGGLYTRPQDYSPGDKFVVIFDSTDVEKNILLFDYPIKDSSDFKFYLEKFMESPPILKP